MAEPSRAKKSQKGRSEKSSRKLSQNPTPKQTFIPIHTYESTPKVKLIVHDRVLVNKAKFIQREFLWHINFKLKLILLSKLYINKCIMMYVMYNIFFMFAFKPIAI